MLYATCFSQSQKVSSVFIKTVKQNFTYETSQNSGIILDIKDPLFFCIYSKQFPSTQMSHFPFFPGSNTDFQTTAYTLIRII